MARLGWCVHGHGASNGGNSSREACAGTLAHIPNAMHKVPFFVLYMIKYILYTYMPSAVLCKSESSCITLEKCVYAVLIRASSAVLHVPKEFPTTPSIKESNKYTHTPQVKQKAPIQHHNFLETTTTKKKQNTKVHRSRKGFLKKV